MMDPTAPCEVCGGHGQVNGVTCRVCCHRQPGRRTRIEDITAHWSTRDDRKDTR